MARVELKSLFKIYAQKNGDVRAVDDVSLTIEDREFMVLVGPSGCGKSTTLRLIAGLEEASSGSIRIGGKVVNDVPPKDRDIAMVFQNYALYPHMSVLENMAFGLKLRGLHRPEIQKRVGHAAEILDIAHLLERKPKALSGGQRQRVALGRAIVRQPKVFLFDEPLSNLDAQMRVQMRTEIAKLHARLAATMIYVTHDQAEAMTLGDRITVMRSGSILQVAQPLELYRKPTNTFVAGFIGSPPMNFLSGVLRAQENGVCFEEANPSGTPFRLRLPERLAGAAGVWAGRPITLGIRPEDIHEASSVRQANPASQVSLAVEVSEPMGHETHLYLTTGAHTFVARVPGGERFDRSRPFQAWFDLSNAHLFDPETEAKIQP